MREFNVTGLCIPEKHYLVDISGKLQTIIELIEKEKYFTINRARQFGKTTTLNQIYHSLKDKYLVIDISFEGLGDVAFSSEHEFCESFINLISKMLRFNRVSSEVIADWEKNKNNMDKLEQLSDKITSLAAGEQKDIVLMIDEVDKSSNNQLFLHFLGMLRNKYLDRDKGLDKTFKSVILAGVYDVKNLKLKIKRGKEKNYNSPWNIAADFKVEMSFNPQEIVTMLVEYEKDYITGMNIEEISNEIYKYTSGYPFLVSKICKIIDEDLDRIWTKEGIELALKILVDESNMLFDDLIKNIENNIELYNLVYNVIIDNEVVQYNRQAHSLGIMFGIFKSSRGRLVVNNKIFEIILYNYMIAKEHMKETGKRLSGFTSMGIYENEDRTLNIKAALMKYQEYMKSVYSKFDKEFVERQGRLLLLAFFKPIINGQGFYFVSYL